MAADKVESKQNEKATESGTLSPFQAEVFDSKGQAKTKSGQNADALPAAFSSGKDGKTSDLTIVDDNISKAMDFAKSRMTPEQIQRVNEQAEVPNRWILEAAKIDQRNEVKAKPGDSYWSIADGLIADREGRKGSRSEVQALMKDIVAHNGKLEADAGNLKVGESVKLPPKKRQS